MHRVVPALEQARRERGKKIKVSAVADALRAVGLADDDEELAIATRLVGGQLLPSQDNAVLGVGFALVQTAACEAYGVAPGDLRSRAHSLGDLGDAIGELSSTDDEGARRGLTLRELGELTKALTRTTDRTAKKDALVLAYRAARPDQAKYLTKAILGELRVGVREGVLEEAIAAAFGRDPKEVHEAAILCTDPGELAILARHDELSRAAFVVGHPIAFMLASPIETVKSALPPGRAAWEDKLDGVRVQVHVDGGGTRAVRLFARGGGDVTAVFPEITRALESGSRSVVLDGELLAVSVDAGGEPRPRPFQALQARLNRRDPDAALLAATPVALFAFDILYDGEPLLAAPWTLRRERLEAFFRDARLAPVAQPTTARRFDPDKPEGEQVDAAYAEARGRGHEGIVLKDVEAPYEAGRRGSAWRKVKRALATLDVVITRAERGHGKRAQVLSDYTFAVRSDDGLVEIGKAYSGLTDAEIAELTTEIEKRTVEHRGHQWIVEPAFVLEVAFDGLQRSTRHSSGFALRFPRIARIRRDKQPGEADTLATVRGLWDAQVASGHREEGEPPARPAAKARPAKKKGKKVKLDAQGRPIQLGLFGGDEE